MDISTERSQASLHITINWGTSKILVIKPESPRTMSGYCCVFKSPQVIYEVKPGLKITSLIENKQIEESPYGWLLALIAPWNHLGEFRNSNAQASPSIRTCGTGTQASVFAL